MAQEAATVLPAGITRVRVVGVAVPALNKRWNNSGEKEDLMAKFEGNKSSDTLLGSSALLQQASSGLNKIGDASGAPGLGDDLFSINIAAPAEISAQRAIIAAEHGVNKWLSLGIIIPLVKVSGKASSKFTVGHNNVPNALGHIAAVKANLNDQLTANPNLPEDQVTAIKQQIAGIDRITAGLSPLKNDLAVAASLKQNLVGMGYTLPENYELSGMGDIEVGGKMKYITTKDIHGTIQAGFRLPTTTHTPDQSNLLDSGIGDDQLDFALMANHEYHPTKNWVIGSSIEYVRQFKDSVSKYVVPKGSTFPLPDLTNDALLDPKISRKLGDEVNAELSTSYYFGDRTWKVSATYMLNYAAASQFSGSKAFLDYDSLGENTEYNAHSAQIGVQYSTIPAFKRKDFAVPMEFRLYYNKRLAGKNASASEFYRLGTLVYF